MKPWGTPVSGPVRYLLASTDTSPSSDPSDNGAPEWPLDVPPGVLSLPDPDDDTFLPSPTVWTATGEDADRLRSLRTSFLNGEFGATTSDFIPIVQPDGSRFLLVMRDLTEFEVDASPVVPWATDGSLVMETSTPLTTTDVRFSVACGTSDRTSTAEGQLEMFSDNGDRLYWKGRADGLPLGDCSVRLVPTDPDEQLRCTAYSSSTELVPVWFWSGWTVTHIFRCRG